MAGQCNELGGEAYGIAENHASNPMQSRRSRQEDAFCYLVPALRPGRVGCPVWLLSSYGAARDCNFARLHCFVRLACLPNLSILLARQVRRFLPPKMMAPPSSWVRRTCGSLRHFQAFFWLRVFPAPKQSPRPPTRR